MGNSCRIFIAVILIISLFTVSVFATPTGTYDLYGTNGRVVTGYTGSGNDYISNFSGHLANIRVYLDQILSFNANISTTIDYYLPALLQRMVDAFSPVSGDTRSMWQLSAAAVSGITAIQSAALGISQDVYNISGYVDGVESSLSSIDSHIDGVEGSLTSIGCRLDTVNYNITQIYDSLYYDSYITLNNYLDSYFQTGTASNPTINNYPYNHTSGPSYFRPVIPTEFITNNEITIYYPINILENPVYNVSCDNSSRTTYFGLSNNLTNWSSSQVTYHIVSCSFDDNVISITYHFDNSFSYSYITCPTFNTYITLLGYGSVPISNYLDYVVNCTPYILATSSQKVNYLQSILEELQNNGNNEIFNDIKNILIDIDNNSDFIQNNNDLEINVDIDAADGQGITAIILKLQDLFDFGVGLQEFLVTLNEFDNLHWFTRLETYEQVNYDPRTNLGYQDLYD